MAKPRVERTERAAAVRLEYGFRSGMRGIGKRFVYILRSDVDPERHYVGLTGDVDNRLEWHNHGPSGHTTEHRPWSPVVSMEFPTEQEARRFERYLKSGSGRAFTRRHFGANNQPGASLAKPAHRRA